jgi:hypothetical protein
MQKKKDIIEVIITGVLILVLLSLAINTVKRTKQAKRLKIEPYSAVLKKDEFRKKTSQEKSPAKEARRPDKEIYKKLEEETKNLKLKRDPFILGPVISTEEISPSGLSITGILWDRENPIAIINDNIVRIGDKIGTNNVVDIKQDSVILNDGIKNFELNLE